MGVVEFVGVGYYYYGYFGGVVFDLCGGSEG